MRGIPRPLLEPRVQSVQLGQEPESVQYCKRHELNLQQMQARGDSRIPEPRSEQSVHGLAVLDYGCVW